MRKNVKYLTSIENAGTQWIRLCAKNGHPEASSVMNGCLTADSFNENHEKRKVIKRAINAITAGLKPEDYDDATTDALMFAGGVVAKINDHFQLQADGAALFGKKSPDRVMRNQADFEDRYQKPSSYDDGDGMSISDLLKGVANLTTTPAVRNALSVGTDASGGFAVPSRLMPGILAAMVPVSSLLQAGAGFIALDEGAKTFTTAAVNSIPTAAWRAEAGAVAVSDPAFRSVVATPRSLSFQFRVSRELLADGDNIQEALNVAIAQAFARELDRAGLRGTGTAPEPRGILNTVGIQAVTNGVNGLALGGYANIFSAVQAILGADSPMPLAAIMSPRSLVKLGGLLDTTNQPLRVPGLLEPVKLIATSQIPNTLTVGTSTDCSEIYIGDFSNMYFAMRESVSVQLLNELYAGTGEIGFACHLRADVVLTYPAAFAVVTGVRA